MLRSTQFTNGTVQDFIPVSGVVYEDVVRLQRNGIGVRFTDAFDSNPVNTDVYYFEWAGVDTSITLDPGAYIIQLTNSVSSFRTVVYEFGPTVGVNYVYLFVNGSQQAPYLAQPLDDVEDVRDGMEASINATSWSGFTVTTLSVGTNQLRITFSDTSDFETYIGRITYKSGYYCTINGEDYLIYYDESPTGVPVPPALEASYDFADLTLMPDGIETYLADPNTNPSYSETLEGVSAISGIPGSDTVPDQYAVINTSEQKIYFWEDLNIGEVIKVVQA